MKLSQITLFEAEVELDYSGIDPDMVEKIKTYKPHLREWLLNNWEWSGQPALFKTLEVYLDKIKDNRFQKILSAVTPNPKNILTLDPDQILRAVFEYRAKYFAPSKRQEKRGRKARWVRLLDEEDLKVFSLGPSDDPEVIRALMDLGRPTAWCIKREDKAREYLAAGPIYLVFLGQEKLLCSTADPSFPELKDVRNDDFGLDFGSFLRLRGVIPGVVAFVSDEDLGEHPELLAESPVKAARWAMAHHRPFPEAEAGILGLVGTSLPGEDARPYAVPSGTLLAISYVVRARRYGGDARWPELERLIVNDAGAVLSYARDVIGGRWPEGEVAICGSPRHIVLYFNDFKDLIGRRWPEGERGLLSAAEGARTSLEASKVASYLFRYVGDIGVPWPEAERFIAVDAYYMNLYRDKVLRWRLEDEKAARARLVVGR